MQALQAEWLERAGPARRDSALRLLIDALPEAPVLTTSVVADLIGRSLRATTQAMDQLVRAGIPGPDHGWPAQSGVRGAAAH